ncbi:MAG: phosphotransferase [Vampirovibrio sp.]|nr:phosphotransferase [Vampirovibrio sp.]
MKTAVEQTSIELTTDAEFVQFCRNLGEQSLLEIPANTEVTVENISGNINRVRRVIFTDASTQTKQSYIIKTLPAEGRLERYPNIIFPKDRLSYEHQYYQQFASQSNSRLQNWTPQIFYVDPPNVSQKQTILQTLVTADLEQMNARALKTFVSTGAAIPKDFCHTFGYHLGLAHLLNNKTDLFNNPAAAENRPYVLTQPFTESVSLFERWRSQPSQQWRCTLQQEFLDTYKDQLYPIAQDLLARFKEDPLQVLTHGDLHCESIFIRGSEPTVIDAELCDTGAAWFDTGMAAAHLWMLSAVSTERLSISEFLAGYEAVLIEAGISISLPELRQNTLRLAGFEIIRRIIGTANMLYLAAHHAQQLLALAANKIAQKETLL